MNDKFIQQIENTLKEIKDFENNGYYENEHGEFDAGAIPYILYLKYIKLKAYLKASLQTRKDATEEFLEILNGKSNSVDINLSVLITGLCYDEYAHKTDLDVTLIREFVDEKTKQLTELLTYINRIAQENGVELI